MPNEDHLDEFAAQQTDPLKRRLVEQFRDMSRSPDIPPSEYPTRLRQVLDHLFGELTTNAASRSDNP